MWFQFWKNGYLIIPDFADDETVDGLKKEIHRIVEAMNPEEHNTVFSTLEMKRVGLYMYFTLLHLTISI